MKVLLIGDVSGNPDEGMKKVSKKVCEYLNKIEGCQSKFVSIIEIIRSRKIYRDYDIANFIGGPTWRTFIYGIILKIALNSRIITIISFIHPDWNLFTKLSFFLFQPNAVIVQSKKWNTICNRYVKNICTHPLAGIDLKKFTSVSLDKKNKLRIELGLPSDKIIILHVGHLNEGRNLKVFNQFKFSDNIFPIIIASSTVAPDKKLVNSLKENKVLIINEFIPNIEKYYQASDFYIFTTTDPNFCIQIPLSVIEALACNLHVITTKFEALPFYFPHNNNKLTYVYSFENLLSLILKLNIKKNKDMLIAKKTLLQFDWGKVTNNLHDFYLTLCKVKNERV